ncbi:MAG: glycosyltransferase family 2 protein [Pirellulaceae bacterium]
MVFIVFSLVVLGATALPLIMVLRNLPLFQFAYESKPTVVGEGHSPSVAVLVPARNEADKIERSLAHLLKNQRSHLKFVVLDDHSEDSTPEIVERLAKSDPRLRLESSEALPAGWNGKQHACWQLANRVEDEVLIFLDADVEVEPDFVERCVSELGRRESSLVSGFPEQRLGSFGEQLLIPMMHYVLLGYLPIDQMRASAKPEFGAGCGQLFIARREDYLECGGHREIAASRHDGLKLPRVFRSAGLKTDLFDASDIAAVRMYVGFSEVVNGLLKNATEGIARWPLIGIFSFLLLFGSVIPPLTLAHALFYGWPWSDRARLIATLVVAASMLLSLMTPFLLARRFQRSVWTTALHPLSVAAFVALQWVAFAREKVGKAPVSWKGRS